MSYYLIQVNQKKSLPRVPGCLIKKHALKLFKQAKKTIKTICYALYPQFKTQNKTWNKTQQPTIQNTQYINILVIASIITAI